MLIYDNDEIIEGGVENAGDSPVNASDLQLAEDVAFIREYLEEQKEKQEQEIAEAEAMTEEASTEEASTEESTTEQSPVDLTLLSPADNTLYLSSEVVYANTNDIYSILLSTRNILLLFFFTFLIFKVGVIFKNALAKLINR